MPGILCIFIVNLETHFTWFDVDPKGIGYVFLLTRHLVLFSRGFYQYVQKEDSGTSTGALIVCESRHGHMSCLGLPLWV